MKVSRWFIVSMVLWMYVGCATTPLPTPSPVPTLVPSPTAIVPSPTGVMSTIVMNRLAPADVPACPGAQGIEKQIEFSWTGIEDVYRNAPESNWTFYRCDAPLGTVAAFYRRWMPEQYGWVQTSWEEHANATLGVYFYSTGTSSVPNRWLYLWFLPDASTKQYSYLVAAWWEAPKSC
ncbi:MAG: hypothetical protein HZB51_25160 [Chloroflexi bacterium]|nr:hypothetical protein [Chloroflexota bacterium]